ncbi:astacin-like metalloprotease toxin 4 [Ornithodoros turicata]|uniref:astacin-like metalloprotease toxin 4 n=1 Tax=Ornithodoros turicata TaxID=34597 RepID=UPI003139735E
MALKEIHDKTCIRWVPRSNETDYVVFIRDEGCYSHVGRVGGRQNVSLGEGCLYHGTVLHEMGHALGYEHEHMRSDRDKYLTVYKENILQDELDQFTKLKPRSNRLLTPFDYDSVMLYGSTVFGKEEDSITMTKKDGGILVETYDKTELSPSDVTEMNLLYKCPGTRAKSDVAKRKRTG